MRNNISVSGTGQFACPRGVPICYRPWGEFWTVGAGFRHQKRPLLRQPSKTHKTRYL